MYPHTWKGALHKRGEKILLLRLCCSKSESGWMKISGLMVLSANGGSVAVAGVEMELVRRRRSRADGMLKMFCLLLENSGGAPGSPVF